MRDGVKLHTVIVIPKGAARAPMILDRTPYNAGKFASGAESPRRALILPLSYGELARRRLHHRGPGCARKIRIRRRLCNESSAGGRFQSHARWIIPPTPTIRSIGWSRTCRNQRQGRHHGHHYDGFTVLMSLVDPHPALKAAAPFNPMVDTWKGDDWFHNGALRQTYADYIYAQTASKLGGQMDRAPLDAYETFVAIGSAGDAGRRGHGSIPFWQRLTQHPAYDHLLERTSGGRNPRRDVRSPVPTLYVHSQWDQEDIYGAPRPLRRRTAIRRGHDNSYLVIGPWRHGGGNGRRHLRWARSIRPATPAAGFA